MGKPTDKEDGCSPVGYVLPWADPQAEVDAQCPIAIGRCVVIPFQVVLNPKEALVRTSLVNFLHQPSNVLILGGADPDFSRALLIVTGPRNM